MIKRSVAIICIACALFAVMMMTGCGSASTKETEPAIKTTIDPQNWAHVEDYKDYGIEEQEETKPNGSVEIPLTTEPTEEVIETEPVETEPEETEPPVEVLYKVAKDGTGALITSDLGNVKFGDSDYNLLTTSVETLEGIGYLKGAEEKNSGITSQYYFDGYQYTRDIDGLTSTICIDADAYGNIRALKIMTDDVSFIDGTIKVGMPLADFYEAASNILASGERIDRLTPAENVRVFTILSSLGYRAIVSCTLDGVQEIAIFAEDYVQSWGPIQN